MYVSASGNRVPGRPRRSQSDPGHPYVIPPYTVQWPAPMRQAADPSMGTSAPGTPHQQSPSCATSLSVELIPGDPFLPHPGSLLAQQISNSPGGMYSPRSPSPQHPGHPRSASGQGSTGKAPQGLGPLIKDVPQPPRTAFNVPSAITVAHLHLAGRGQGQGQDVLSQSQIPSPPTKSQMASLQRQGSHHAAYPQPPASAYQNMTPTTVTYPSHHHSSYLQPSTTHHVSRARSRSRPPSAASHRYASSITPPMYGHGSSASLNASRTSLNGGVSSRTIHHATLPTPGISSSHHLHHQGTINGSTHTHSGSTHRSRSRTRVPSAGTYEGITMTTQSVHDLKESPSSRSPPIAARDIRRAVHRPALPDNYDGQIQTRYVSMLLALDGISPVFNVLASFFTWILLAGFVLFPGTFASWKNEPSGTAEGTILSIVNHISLFGIAFMCTGIGICGMCWLWWKWHENYIWLTNRIFVPGFLNSVAGVISTLSSIYGTQAGTFGETEEATIIVTGSLSIIFGMLVIFYEYWLLRNLRLEHDQEVGVEKAGKHGEGALGEKRDEE